jgi:hypothetical protein
MAMAAALYSENFEVDPTANWTVNNGPSDEAHSFYFDYSSVGIPAAPSGTGTHGMKLQTNLTNGVFGGMSASPTGQSFSGDYTVKFDWWENFNGPAPAGGSGSTNLGTFGVGTSGTKAQWAGAVQDSVWFGATGDGGSTSDWRAYSPAAGTSYAANSGVYAANAVANTASYYSSFGGVSAPAAQLALYPQQTGTTVAGSTAFAWHLVEIAKADDVITWTVDGKLIATVNLATPTPITLGGGNIFFGRSDINATSSTDVNDSALLFTLIDNIVVTPEPASLSLLVIGSLALLRRRR